MAALFEDRFHAGRFLGTLLGEYTDREEVIVLALPRGGVPVGFEVAQALGLPLDVFLVRKLGVPGHEELAMGAIASGGARILNRDVIHALRISPGKIEEVAAAEQRELDRREVQYRHGRLPLDLRGRGIILVDDGLATGASMRAAAAAIRHYDPAFITVAVPVGSEEICSQLKGEVDEVICGQTPEPFHAVGSWYSSFSQVSDDEVRQLLDRSAHRQSSVAGVSGQHI